MLLYLCPLGLYNYLCCSTHHSISQFYCISCQIVNGLKPRTTFYWSFIFLIVMNIFSSDNKISLFLCKTTISPCVLGWPSQSSCPNNGKTDEPINHCTNSVLHTFWDGMWPKLGQLEPFLFSKNDDNSKELGTFCENGECKLRTTWNCGLGRLSFYHYRKRPVDREKQKEEKRNCKRFNTLDLDVPETRLIPDPSDIPTFICELIKSLLLGVTLQILLDTSRVPNKLTGSRKVFTGVV